MDVRAKGLSKLAGFDGLAKTKASRNAFKSSRINCP